MRDRFICMFAAMIWTQSTGQAFMLATNYKLFFEKYEADKPILWFFRDKPKPRCKLWWQLFWWQSSNSDCQEDTNVLSMLADVLFYPCTLLLDVFSLIGSWINKNWSSTTELTLLYFVVSCLFVTLFFNWIRTKKNADMIYNFIQEAKTVNEIVNNLEALRANQERMEDLLEEVNVFHHDAKIKIQENREALLTLELKVLQEAFTGKDAVIDRNPGYPTFLTVCKMLNDEEVQSREGISPRKMALLKYSPMTSCDVEQSFSSYKNILSDRRLSFTPENMEK